MKFGPRTLFLFLLLLAMPAASYQWLFKPLNASVVEAQQLTADRKQQLHDVSIKMADTKNLPRELDDLRKALKLCEDKLPAEKEYNQVFEEISKLAVKHGLTSKSVRLLKVVQGNDYSEQPIKLVYTGSFQHSFYPFLEEVEGLPRLMRIDEMKMTMDDKSPPTETVEMTLSIYFDAARKVTVAQ